MNNQYFFKDDVVAIKPGCEEKMSSIGLDNYEGLFVIIRIVQNTVAVTEHFGTGKTCYIPTKYLEHVSRSPAFLDMPVTLL